MNFLTRLVSVKPRETQALFASCAYFFLILCSYYIIRPIRDEMVIANGVANIQWMLLATVVVLLLLTPLFGWVTTRFKTRQFLSYCTLFFASHLVIFYFLFDVEQRSPAVTQAFYIWVNVFNMFIVSLFWSFMNDVFGREQAKRLFAFIAAGGTAGAICGPIITRSLVETVGLAPLLLISAFTLALSLLLILWLIRWNNEGYDDTQTTHKVNDKALKGGVIGGITLIYRSPYLMGICVFILLYAVSITFVQIRQAELVEATYNNPAQRTQLFATIDLVVNVLVLVFQLFITSRIIKWLGFRTTLMIVPLGITLGFGIATAAPSLMIMICLEVFRRVGDYSIMKPAREMLFNVVSREEKYKAKNFIDTTVLRSGSASSAWIYTAVKSIAGASSTIAGVSLLLGVAWCSTAFWLGHAFNRLQSKPQSGRFEENAVGEENNI